MLVTHQSLNALTVLFIFLFEPCNHEHLGPTKLTAHSSFQSRETQHLHCWVAGTPTDDRLYAFEAIGVLLGQEELPAEQQLQALESLLGPLQTQIESHLPQCAQQSASNGLLVGSGWVPFALRLLLFGCVDE